MQPVMRWSTLKLEREIIIGTIPLQNMYGAPPPFSDVVIEETSPSAPPEHLMPPPYQEERKSLFNKIWLCLNF